MQKKATDYQRIFMKRSLSDRIAADIQYRKFSVTSKSTKVMSFMDVLFVLWQIHLLFHPAYPLLLSSCFALFRHSSALYPLMSPFVTLVAFSRL